MLRFLTCRGVFAIAFCTVLAAPIVKAQQVKGDRVGGRVVSDLDGHPLGGAVLTLTTVHVDATAQEVAATIRADEDGHFQFGPVAAGKYQITGAAKHYLPTSYMQHELYWTALVTGAGLATDTLELRLWPAAGVYGRVVDDAGEPVIGASVRLYLEDLTATPTVRRVQTATVDDDGAYEFDALQRGRYYLLADGTPWYAVHPTGDPVGAPVAFRETIDPALDVVYPMTFYPDATDSDGATALVVADGEHLSADLHLHVQHAMTLTVHLPEGEQSVDHGLQLNRRIFGMEEAVAMTQVNGSPGTLKLVGVPPGRYEVEEVGSERRRVGAVDLTSGSATMDATKVDSTEMTVTLHGTNLGPFGEMGVNIRSGSSDSRVLGGRVSENGVATFQHVPAGEYRFYAFARGREIGVTGVLVDGKPATNGHVQVTHNAAVELDVTSMKMAVEGFAKRAGGAGPGSMVVLVPAGSDTSGDLFRRDQSDLDGSFVFHDVVPGNYIVVAIDDGWGLRWTDIKEMEPYLMKGLPVSIRDGGTAEVKLAAVQTQPR